jgi:glycosyltransferase involved in cell wall biosynthesis
MQQCLLIDSTGKTNEFLASLLKALEKDGCQIKLLSGHNSWLRQKFKERQLACSSLFQPLNKPWLLVVLWPCLAVWNFFKLLFYQNQQGIKTLLCLGVSAKLLFSAPARILGWRVVWLEEPNFDYDRLSKFILKFYLRSSKRVKLVCFSLTTKLKLLSLGANEDNIKLIWPGISLEDFQNQDSLFQNYAKQNYLAAKKFFTIGTIIDFNQLERSEILMRAVGLVKQVIPQVRLIIIGDGQARAQAQWLTKKLGLEAQVWLVGSQTDLKKWYANFDVFVVASDQPTLDDFMVSLIAMANGVPVIAPLGKSLEDCFLGGQAGILLSLDNEEELSIELIKLEQQADFKKSLSVNAKRVVKDFFTLARASQEFKKIL